LLANYLGGFKVFYQQSTENLIATRLMGTYSYVASPKWLLGGRLLFRDTTLEHHDRDYLLASAEAFQRVSLLSWLELETFLTGRYYFFKPDEYMDYSVKFSHVGPAAGFRLHLRGSDSIQAAAFYQASVRFFDHHAREYHNGILQPSGDKRLDVRHVGGFRVKHQIKTWGTKRMILEMSYFLSVNDSNSSGSSAAWHRLRLVLSMQLPLDILLHIMGTLQFTDYLDGIYVEGDLYEPDADENENSLVLRLSFPLWRGLSLVLHGAVYRSDFQSSELDVLPFSRETVMLGLAYDLPF
jgi:hypothetical protein